MHFQHEVPFTDKDYRRMGMVGTVPPSPHTKVRDGQNYQNAQDETRRFTIDEYHLMGELGIIPPGLRTELLDGRIYAKSKINPPHSSSTRDVCLLLSALYGEAAIVNNQSPIIIPNSSEPLPDITVLKPREDRYSTSHPKPTDVLFLIEVADSTIYSDKKEKAALYAKGDITEYWILDLKGDRLIVHRNPTSSGYADVKDHSSGRIAAIKLPFAEIEIDDLLIYSTKRSIQPPKPKGSRKR